MSRKSIHQKHSAFAGVDSKLPTRLKEADLQPLIVDTVYYRPGGEHSTITICELHLISGFVVVGTSGCVHPDGFSKMIGETTAYEQALNRLWELEGYRLRHAWAEDQLYYRRVIGAALQPVTFNVTGNTALTLYTPVALPRDDTAAPAETVVSSIETLINKARAWLGRRFADVKTA